jgi:hypothetical protein
MLNGKFNKIALSVILAIGVSSAAMANETSSSLRGKVQSTTGAPVKDAVVVIEHTPTGTKRTVKLDASGSFSARGLRVGGPYLVTVDSDEFADQKTELFLSLGETSQLNFSLQPDNVERITVTGSNRHNIVFGDKNGIGSTYNETDIARSPMFDRDLKDIIRQNPLVNISDSDDGEMSVGGTNPRFNSISIDGVKQNDDFGLNGNGYPTSGSPISMLSIEQVSVDVTPFNTQASGFTGASVNAVTKSGRNELFGEMFYEYASDSMAGTPKNEDGEDIALDFERSTFGGALGGKIIEDTLFFFVSYEESKNPFVNVFGPQGVGASNEKDWLDLDTVAEIQRISSEVYGVDVGGLANGLSNDSEKSIIKLDWNINDDHRAALTYQLTEDNSINPQNVSRSNNFALTSNWYNVDAKVESLALQVYSFWGDDLTTQFSMSKKDVVNSAVSFSDSLNEQNLGQACIRINPTNESCSRAESVFVGADPFRHANDLENETFAVDFTGELTLNDDHTLSFGLGVEEIDIFNQFVPFSRGTWDFDSIEDFENRNASSVSYSDAYTGVSSDAGSTFSIQNNHLYIEDKWDINDDLWVNFGARYEAISTTGEIRPNATFTELYGKTNTTSLSGKSIFLPRIGFNWSAAENLTLSGGVGRYYGGTPNVWISNSYSNDGLINVRGDVDGVDLTNADFTTKPVGATLTSGDGDTNSIASNFQLPSEWRYGITANYTADLGEFLGDKWDLEASYQYVKEKDPVQWRELYRETQDIAVAPDGRNIYVGVPAYSRDRFDLELTNGDKGGVRKTFTLAASKNFENGVYLNMSYANQDASNLVPGTSSTANSNFEKYQVADRNNPDIGRSRYEVEHSFKFNVSYTKEFFEGYASTFTLQGERSSGRPYSWVYADGYDTFGSQKKFDDGAFLPYIPTGADDPNVSYGEGYSYDQLSAVLSESGLDRYAGGIVPRNTADGPWNSRLDFFFSQEIKGFSEDHRGMFYVSVKNVLNLIDSSAGKIEATNFFNSRDLVQADYDELTNTYVYNEGFSDDAPTYLDAERSAWRLKVGINYKF